MLVAPSGPSAIIIVGSRQARRNESSNSSNSSLWSLWRLFLGLFSDPGAAYLYYVIRDPQQIRFHGDSFQRPRFKRVLRTALRALRMY